MTLNLWCVYLLKCNDDTLYCWITNDFNKRLKNHNEQKWAKYTKYRIPVTLLYKTENIYTKSEASKIEYQVKLQNKNNKKKFLENLI